MFYTFFACFSLSIFICTVLESVIFVNLKRKIERSTYSSTQHGHFTRLSLTSPEVIKST